MRAVASCTEQKTNTAEHLTGSQTKMTAQKMGETKRKKCACVVSGGGDGGGGGASCKTPVLYLSYIFSEQSLECQVQP